MKQIHVLGKRGGVYLRHFHPLRIHKRALADIGIQVKYFSNPGASHIQDCDALIFMEAGYRDILPIQKQDRAIAVDFLQGFLSKFKRVIWFDDHDSSGMLRTYVFPYVDVYAKAQLMLNKSYYKEEHLTGAAHRDFVNDHYQITDEMFFKGTITDSEIGKLRLGWNLGLMNWGSMFPSSRLRRVYDYVVASGLAEIETPKLRDRQVHVTSRLGMCPSAPTVYWWRQKTTDLLGEIASRHREYKIKYEGTVNRSQYHEEMRSAVVSPSPFGVGEICYRDFECFMNGSLLLKPRMDHLETYPDLYVDGETYIAHEWDFSDFEEKVLDVLSNPVRYEPIAREGQRRFVRAFNDGAAFAQTFRVLVDDNEAN